MSTTRCAFPIFLFLSLGGFIVGSLERIPHRVTKRLKLLLGELEFALGVMDAPFTEFRVSVLPIESHYPLFRRESGNAQLVAASEPRAAVAPQERVHTEYPAW
jgi:hypothetical protein